MREILGKAKTVRELLKGVKYSIDYYQREYKWQDKQVRELVDDLTGKFLEEHDPAHARKKVADYPHYFLGSIISSKTATSDKPYTATDLAAHPAEEPRRPSQRGRTDRLREIRPEVL
jgi:hypothetical protein